jgi:peroxiredoxin
MSALMGHLRRPSPARDFAIPRVARVALMALAVGGPTAALTISLAWAGAPAGVGVSAPAMRAALDRHVLRTVDGVTLSLASLRGEVVVINFWASWCRPCRKELPELDALHATLAARGGRVLAVSIDEDPRNVERFVRAHGLTLPVYHDGPEGLARALDLGHIPYTLVLDRRGEVAYASSGADRAALEALEKTTLSLLASATREEGDAR